jgi:hypothetical protein
MYTRPDVLMNFGFGDARVLDGKTALYGNIVSSTSIRMQFDNYYRFGVASVKAVTWEGVHYIPPTGAGSSPRTNNQRGKR